MSSGEKLMLAYFHYIEAAMTAGATAKAILRREWGFVVFTGLLACVEFLRAGWVSSICQQVVDGRAAWSGLPAFDPAIATRDGPGAFTAASRGVGVQTESERMLSLGQPPQGVRRCHRT